MNELDLLDEATLDSVSGGMDPIRGGTSPIGPSGPSAPTPSDPGPLKDPTPRPRQPGPFG